MKIILFKLYLTWKLMIQSVLRLCRDITFQFVGLLLYFRLVIFDCSTPWRSFQCFPLSEAKSTSMSFECNGNGVQEQEFNTAIRSPVSVWHVRSFPFPQESPLLFSWCFMVLQHILGHFGRSQLTWPHCSWASLLSSLPVLSAHSFASNWQLPFLNQRKGEHGLRNIFMTKSQCKNVLLDMRIKSATVRIPGGCASDRATAPGPRGSVRAQVEATSIQMYALNTPD